MIMKEGILHQVPRLIKLFVVLTPLSAILFRRNDRHHTLALRLIKNRVRIIAPVRQQALGCEAINQGDCLSTICCCTLCNKRPDRHTMRIHGQMQFCVEPPFVRLIS